MATSFIGLNTAVSGMYSNQKALEVTGHNISNIGTPGYARQQAIMRTANTQYVANNWVEMGADIEQVRQIRNTFLDNIYRNEANSLGYWEARYNSVKDLEAILGEPMLDGLQNTLNEFWNSWNELSKAPDSLTMRAIVKQRGEALVYHLNHMGNQINKLQDDINTEVIKRIDEVNDITGKIAGLNDLVAKAKTAGNNANDYYDQRNYLVDQLSKLVKADIREHPDGHMDVLVGGYFLVSKTKQTRIVPAQNSSLSHFVVPEVEGLGVEINVGVGEIRGLLESRGKVSGAKGSYENGTPNTTADITFAVDVSNISEENLSVLRDNMESYIKDIKNRGLDYNLRLMAYDGAGVVSEDFGTSEEDFVNALNALTSTGNVGSDFGMVVDRLNETSPFTSEANRYLYVYTQEGLGGDDEQIDGFADTLKGGNIKASVITNTTGEVGWDAITHATGGSLYDIANAEEAISEMGVATVEDVNKQIATVDESLDIISSVRKMLNAVVNIVAREVNSLHLAGKTLNGNDGGLFFEPIEDNIPMEMGNIKISDGIKDLNNIVASATGAKGDNGIAHLISSLRNKDIMKSSTQILSTDSYYQYIILRVGNVGNEALKTTQNQKSLVLAADNDRQSTMGVSLDEEMSNMIKFKYAYNAATKTIGVINEMLDTLINRMGSR